MALPKRSRADYMREWRRARKEGRPPDLASVRKLHVACDARIAELEGQVRVLEDAMRRHPLGVTLEPLGTVDDELEDLL